MSEKPHICITPVGPMAKTGYGTQVKHLIQYLGSDYEWTVVHGGQGNTWGAGETTDRWGPPVRLLQTTGDQHGSEVMPAYEEIYDFDLIIGFIDAFATPYLSELDTPTVAVFPIDSPTFAKSERWQSHVQGNDALVAYSQFGYNQLLNSSLPQSKCHYIPHGIDTHDTYRAVDDSHQQAALDRYTGSLSVDDDAITLFHVGANVGSGRKQIPRLLTAFDAAQANTSAEVRLLIHTDPAVEFPSGFNYDEFVRREGIEHVHYPEHPPRLVTWTDEELVGLYSTADYYVSASEAEGFGLPLVEAAACGTPLVAPDNSAQTEHVTGAGGVLVETDEVSYANYTPYLQAQYPPRQEVLTQTLTDIIEHRYSAVVPGLEESWFNAAWRARQYAMEDCEIRDIVDERWRPLITDLTS